MSDDSNDEPEFNIEPEISSSLSTALDAEPQRGHEAESRFNSDAEASTSMLSNADPFDKGRLCPHSHFFNGDPDEYQDFCQKYNILADVVLSRVKSGEIKDKARDHPEHIIVPLMAICEAGLRFPLHPFLREVLSRFNLAPHQVSINNYRIIVFVIALVENHGLEFTIADLVHTYTMSRLGRTGRRYLTSSLKMEPLITSLPDTDKWADFYLEVHGNYEFGDAPKHHPVRKVSDTRGLL